MALQFCHSGLDPESSLFNLDFRWSLSWWNSGRDWQLSDYCKEVLETLHYSVVPKSRLPPSYTILHFPLTFLSSWKVLHDQGLIFVLLSLEIDLEWDQFVPGGEIVRFLGRENTLLGIL